MDDEEEKINEDGFPLDDDGLDLPPEGLEDDLGLEDDPDDRFH